MPLTAIKTTNTKACIKESAHTHLRATGGGLIGHWVSCQLRCADAERFDRTEMVTIHAIVVGYIRKVLRLGVAVQTVQ